MHVTHPNTSSIDTNAGVGGSSSSNGSSSSGAASFQSLLDQLNTFVSGTPSQQMQAEILGQLGLTQAQVDQMDPKEKAALEEKIKQLIKTETQAQQQAAQNPQALQVTQQVQPMPAAQTLQGIQEAQKASKEFPII
jgi:hypothetical protein